MIRVVAAVIIEEGKVLLGSRPADKPPCGWEFPGGKIEAGETPDAALKRELREELALEIDAADTIYLLRREKLTIRFIRAFRQNGSVPVPKENQECFWVPLAPQVPKELLKNDLEFWKFLNGGK